LGLDDCPGLGGVAEATVVAFPCGGVLRVAHNASTSLGIIVQPFQPADLRLASGRGDREVNDRAHRDPGAPVAALSKCCRSRASSSPVGRRLRLRALPMCLSSPQALRASCAICGRTGVSLTFFAARSTTPIQIRSRRYRCTSGSVEPGLLARAAFGCARPDPRAPLPDAWHKSARPSGARMSCFPGEGRWYRAECEQRPCGVWNRSLACAL